MKDFKTSVLNALENGADDSIWSPGMTAPEVIARLVDWSRRFAESAQEQFECTGYCLVCDLHIHASDCPVVLVLGLPDENEDEADENEDEDY